MNTYMIRARRIDSLEPEIKRPVSGLAAVIAECWSIHERRPGLIIEVSRGAKIFRFSDGSLVPLKPHGYGECQGQAALFADFPGLGGA